MATYHRDKRVLVAVYVEKPKNRRWQSNSHQKQQNHHHHHHHHLHLHQAKNDCHSPGYNRKAHLLEYSRQLRESARSQSSSPLLHPQPASDHHHRHNLQPMTRILSVRKKRKHSATPTCLGNWKFLIPGFIRTLLMRRHKKDKKRKKNGNTRSGTTKIRAVMRSFQVQRKGGFTSKMFASLRKHR